MFTLGWIQLIDSFPLLDPVFLLFLFFAFLVIFDCDGHFLGYWIYFYIPVSLLELSSGMQLGYLDMV